MPQFIPAGHRSRQTQQTGVACGNVLTVVTADQVRPVRALFESPQHPYTVGLLGSIPQLEVERTRLASIEGQVPSPLRRGAGCSFADRCPFADMHCHAAIPELRDLGERHQSACWKAPLDPDVLMAGQNEALRA